MKVNYNFNGCIINLFPSDKDTSEYVESMKNWKEHLDELIQEDLKDRKRKDDSKNSLSQRRQILSSSSKIKLEKELDQKMEALKRQSVHKKLKSFIELIASQLFIVRVVRDTKITYPQSIKTYDQNTYQANKSLITEYYIYSD